MNKKKQKLESKKALLSTPFDTVKEILESKNIPMLIFAKEMSRFGINVKLLKEIAKGKEPITKWIATALCHILIDDVSFWLNLQAQYDQELKEIEEMETILKKQTIV